MSAKPQWQTAQFVTPDQAIDRSKPLIDILREYHGLADQFLHGTDVEYVAEVGTAPKYEISLAPMNAAATQLMPRAASAPRLERIALMLRAYSECVAGLVDQGHAEAAVVNAMRLERLYLQLEYAMGIEQHAARGLRIARSGRANMKNSNEARRAEADQAALAAVSKWQGARQSVLADLTQSQIVRRYLKVARPPERQAKRLRALLKAGGIR